MVDQVQLIAPQILNGGRVGRAATKAGKLPHGADITGLRLPKRLPHASQDSRHLSSTGIAIGRAQVQYALGGSAKSAENHRGNLAREKRQD